MPHEQTVKWRKSSPSHASARPSRASAYRGRIAPSPTGLLHLGHARTFLVAFERARDARGALVLRDEDLDPQRSRAEFAAAMIEDLRWIGIDWQEGPDVGGPFGPYEQSARRAFYEEAWRALVAAGHAYPCVCSRRDLAQSARAPHESPQPHADDEPIYPGTCRPRAHATIKVPDSPRGVNWRFRVPDGEAVSFDDLNLGPQRFVAGRDFGDFLVWRRDDVPSYQIACAVDDASMRITEVVRGADLLKSTARQILLQRALGHATPDYFHCELVRDERGERLAKRHDALALRHLRERGLTPAEVRAQFSNLM
ncbi:MAG: tRNA glutamyl-Q(34) synthetase GluQRS [Acidobacteriota bacterium]|nr:tRNA glutamyl-Q(34) synthetase GluQRS [Acidobacteriota bacterium]